VFIAKFLTERPVTYPAPAVIIKRAAMRRKTVTFCNPFYTP